MPRQSSLIEYGITGEGRKLLQHPVRVLRVRVELHLGRQWWTKLWPEFIRCFTVRTREGARLVSRSRTSELSKHGEQTVLLQPLVVWVIVGWVDVIFFFQRMHVLVFLMPVVW